MIISIGIGVALMMVIITAVFALSSKASLLILKMDLMFSAAHKTKDGTSPVIRKTKLGGVLSVAVLFTIIIVIAYLLKGFITYNSIFTQTVAMMPIQLPSNGTYISFISPDSKCVVTNDLVIGFTGGYITLTYNTDPNDPQTCKATWTCQRGCTPSTIVNYVRLSLNISGAYASNIIHCDISLL